MKKDPGLLIPTDKAVPVISPAGETKRMKLEKKKGNLNVNMNSVSTPFTSFCDSTPDIPKCGPIYVANIVLVNPDGTPATNVGINSASNINPIVAALQMVKFYVRSYFSIVCCLNSTW